MEGCCRSCMPCCSRLWNWIWPDFRYPTVPNHDHVIANPAAQAAEIRTVSGDIRAPSPKKRPVQLYAALFDFEARSDDELTVKEGDKLSVIEKRGEYVLAKKLTGSLESGLIPANYVALLQDEFAKHKWYYGNINRVKAEKLLLASQNKDGSFLVRISESHSNEYTISARSEGKVFHFRIQRSIIGAYFVSDKISFATLGELISYYQKNTRSLGVLLVEPCAQQNTTCLSLFSAAEGQVLTSAHLIYMGSQIAEGMAYLEDRNIVHRDLAARNILVGDDLVCKVADFGLARIIKDSVYTASRNTKIPVRWTAPEAAIYQRFSVKSDVWSFAVLLYEMMSRGKMPYEGKSNKEVLDLLSSGFRLPCPNRCPQNIYRIMMDCWASEPSKRPSFHALHSQLDSIYARIYFKTIEV
ncbi:tyrosine-protein kinase Srms [Solea solea]|uniref:tyrosine-protein kinase Srms n=1 Tax=Solea solea TaxID=90069 RepID=UPI00272B5213|nr:tyrosine-protein kinase Srms [Solea solea]